VEVELVVYKKIDAKKTEETDENVLSSSVMDEDEEEKVSASFIRDEGNEKTSSSTFGIEPDGNYTKEQVNWDESDGFKHYYPSSNYSEDKPSNKIHPTYGIVQKVSFYTGQTNQDGEIDPALITIIYKTGKKDSQNGQLFKVKRKNAKGSSRKRYLLF